MCLGAEAYMIFLTSYDRDSDIYHLCGDDVRRPTLQLCGEYQAPEAFETP